MKEVGKIFEVVIFTASISKYASPLLDILDKEKNIQYRLYREHCTFINGIYIKDLKKCNRNLKDVIIVDNSPIAYTFDSDNGLPIKTWIKDPEDKELMKILPVLEFLSKTKDVRVFINRFVYNNKILYDEASEIIKMKEIIDKKNVKNNDKYVNNIKMIKNEKLVDSNLNENEKNKSIKYNKFIIKKHNSFFDMEIRNRNNDFKLYLINKDNNTSNNTQNTFREKGFNTINNMNKMFGNITVNESDLNYTKSNTNLNTLNIKINKIKKIKSNNNKKGKKNCFRFKATERQQEQYKIAFNNIININNIDPSLPMTLLLSNITKRILTPKASYKEKTKNIKKIEKNNFNNLKLIYKQNENNGKNKKRKYINLLEKYKNNKITVSLVNKQNNINKNNIKINYSMKNMNYNKPFNLRVSSSINNYLGYALENKFNRSKEKTGTFNNKASKSKSTENYLLYSHSIKHPKTPKLQHRQKVAINNNNNINFFKGIHRIKNINKKNNNSIESYREMYNRKNYNNIIK